MKRPIFSNLSTYKAIAETAYEQMLETDKVDRTPKSEGEGWIIKYDPEQKSFKSAMITLVFTGIWLEALLHLLIVREYGETEYQKYDHKSYEEKLRLLGITNEPLLGKVQQFRATRKELVHEKAHFNQATIKTAQKEAKIAREVMLEISRVLETSNTPPIQ